MRQVWGKAIEPASLLRLPYPELTLLGPQSRCWGQITQISSSLYPTRGCGLNRVITPSGLHSRCGDNQTLWCLHSIQHYSSKRVKARYTSTRKKKPKPALKREKPLRKRPKPALTREKSLGHHIEFAIGTGRLRLPYLYFCLLHDRHIAGYSLLYHVSEWYYASKTRRPKQPSPLAALVLMGWDTWCQ